jgi:hypothetical protein
MTATPVATSVPATRDFGAARHVVAVLRLLFVNKRQLLYTPIGGQIAIFLLNYAIWWIIIVSAGANPGNHPKIHLEYSGAVLYTFVFAMIIAVQAMLRTFPFSLGFGVTRRDFYLGSSVAFVILAAIFAAVVTLLGSIELATNGWGIGGYLFAPAYFSDSFWLARFAVYFLLLLFLMFLGAVVAAIYMRWRAFGVSLFFILLGVVIVAAIAVIALTHEWTAVWGWVDRTGAFGLVVWSLIPTAISAVGGFLVLRRATPKS